MQVRAQISWKLAVGKAGGGVARQRATCTGLPTVPAASQEPAFPSVKPGSRFGSTFVWCGFKHNEELLLVKCFAVMPGVLEERGHKVVQLALGLGSSRGAFLSISRTCLNRVAGELCPPPAFLTILQILLSQTGSACLRNCQRRGGDGGSEIRRVQKNVLVKGQVLPVHVCSQKAQNPMEPPSAPTQVVFPISPSSSCPCQPHTT